MASTFWALTLAVALAGCSLNPQPLPPGGGGDPTGASVDESLDAGASRDGSSDASDAGDADAKTKANDTDGAASDADHDGQAGDAAGEGGDS